MITSATIVNNHRGVTMWVSVTKKIFDALDMPDEADGQWLQNIDMSGVKIVEHSNLTVVFGVEGQ